MYNPNDPVGKTVENMAMLFAFVADEVIKENGEEKGSTLVKRAVRRFANVRADGIKDRIKADGKQITFENIDEYSDYPPNEAWDCDSFAEGPVLREINRKCPFAAAFRKLGMEKVGKLYCEEIDVALNEAFFGKIEFSRPRLFDEGPDAPCEMIVKILEKR